MGKSGERSLEKEFRFLNRHPLQLSQAAWRRYYGRKENPQYIYQSRVAVTLFFNSGYIKPE